MPGESASAHAHFEVHGTRGRCWCDIVGADARRLLRCGPFASFDEAFAAARTMIAGEAVPQARTSADGRFQFVLVRDGTVVAESDAFATALERDAMLADVIEMLRASRGSSG